MSVVIFHPLDGHSSQTPDATNLNRMLGRARFSGSQPEQRRGVLPVGSTRVDEEDLPDALMAAVEQKSRALSAGHAQVVRGWRM